jgi:glycosyltransferase involved in cell wall biosynthesis
MKIVFDQQVFSWQQYGGISRYIYGLARGLTAEYRQNVAVVAPLYVNQYLKQAPKSLKVLGMPIKQTRRTGRVLRAINWAMAWPIIRYLHPDIVHETYYSASRIAPKSAKVVLTVYDMIHERFSDQFSAFDATSKEKAIAVARADHIICISEQTRQDLIDFLGVNPAKTSVVYLGFSLTSQPATPQKIDSLMRPFLLYVGNRDGYKNFVGILQAYAVSDKLKSDFDLICFGGGAFTNKEISLIKQLGLSTDTVRQISSSNDAVLAGYYQAASAFVYPSLYEGFGIPPLEAMSFNCPVVCSNVSSIPEVVGNAGLMFNPNDTQSIRLAIEQVVGDSALRESLIARGQERLKQFSWERCAQETLDVYRKVLA